MQKRIRNLSVPSPSIPIARGRIRTVEVLLSLLVITIPLMTIVVPTDEIAIFVDIGLLLVFVSPPFLALVALVGVLDDGFSIGAIVVALLALGTLYVAFVSVYVLINPPEGGGVYGGHLFTFVAGAVLAVGVLARTITIFVLRRTDVSLGWRVRQ